MNAPAGDVLDALVRAAASDDPAAFDATLGRVLEHARDAADPPLALQALIAQRLQTGGGPPAEELPAGESPAGDLRAAPWSRGSGVVAALAVAPRWARYAKGLVLLGAGMAIGFAWGRAPQWWQGTEPSEREAPVDIPLVPPAERPSPLPASSTPSAPTASNTPPAPAPMASRTPAPAPLVRAHSVPTRATRTPDAESLRLALEQLRKAQLFLRAGEPQRALEALDQLEARVPTSVLQEEREVTRTLAWCDTGDPQDAARASALAQRLLERAPDSVYAVSLRESCAGKAALLEQMREHTSNRGR